MVRSAPPILLVGEDSGTRVELEGADLPDPSDNGLVWGGKVKKSVSQHQTGATTVQVNGREPEPIVLEGLLSDRHYGREGHALRARDRLEELSRSGEIIRLEYESDSVWGLLDTKFEERRRDRIDYRLRFHPFWTEPPETTERIGDLQQTPSNATVKLENAASDLVDAAEQPARQSVNDSIVKDVLEAIGKVQNGISRVTDVLSDVRSYKALAEQQIQTVRAQIANTFNSATRTVTELRDWSAVELEPNSGYSSGLERLEAAKWRADTITAGNATAARLRLFLIRMRENKTPPSGRSIRVDENETIRDVAERELGDWKRWTEIADLNDLDSDSISPGDELELPAD